jgi:hypothetical protein
MSLEEVIPARRCTPRKHGVINTPDRDDAVEAIIVRDNEGLIWFNQQINN